MATKQQSQTDLLYLQQAFSLARLAQFRTLPNPQVGAVVVADGKVVGTGYHKDFNAPHAERVALQEAGARARGAVLYVTLEPCAVMTAHKKNRPCVEVIVEAGITRVVIGALDCNPLQRGQGVQALKRHKISCKVYDYTEHFIRQNEAYVCTMRNNRACATIKWAQTIDGYSADSTGHSQWISDKGALRYAHSLRSHHQAVLVGYNTALLDNPELTVRHGYNKSVTRIVVDPLLSLPLKRKFFAQCDRNPTILFHAGVTNDVNKIKALKQLGVQLYALPPDSIENTDPSHGDHTDSGALPNTARQSDNRVAPHHAHPISIKSILECLYTTFRISSVLIEGGAKTIAQCINEEMWDKIVTVIVPKLLVGGTTIRGRARSVDSPIALPLSRWMQLTHFNSQCMVGLGYRETEASFGISAQHYTGMWHV